MFTRRLWFWPSSPPSFITMPSPKFLLIAASLFAGATLLPGVASAETLSTTGKQCLLTSADTGVTQYVQGEDAVGWCIAMFDAAANNATTTPTVVLKPNPLKNNPIACVGSSQTNGLTFYTFVNPDPDAARQTCLTQRDVFLIPTQFIGVQP
jgi:hypothetical protein